MMAGMEDWRRPFSSSRTSWCGSQRARWVSLSFSTVIQFNSWCMRFQGQGSFVVVWVHGSVFTEHSLLVSHASLLVVTTLMFDHCMVLWSASVLISSGLSFILVMFHHNTVNLMKPGPETFYFFYLSKTFFKAFFFNALWKRFSWQMKRIPSILIIIVRKKF